jgi:molecular chaperone GrpE
MAKEKKKGVPPEDESVDLFEKSGATAGDPAETAEAAENAEETVTETSAQTDAAAENADAETEADTAEEAAEAGEDGKEQVKRDPRDEKIAELQDKVLRQQAEFINYRNRTDKEKAQMFEIGAKSAFEKVLPVIDNFERGLATLSDEEKEQPFASGIDKTYKQLMTVLTEAGVTPIEAVGATFDPELHNAVMHVEDESVGENIVVEEFQKGYKYHDTVLRHSMVKVAN